MDAITQRTRVLPQAGRRPLTPEDCLGIARRRWLLIILPGLLGPVIAYGISLKLPSRFTSRSLILIERQKVPDSYVKALITEDVNARIANLQEQVLSRSHLQPIIETQGLFNAGSGHVQMDDAILQMHKAIELTPLKPIVGGRDEVMPGFYIDVTLNDAHKAQDVCADIASIFVEENIKQRKGSVQGTANFLQDELDDAKRRLDDQDAKLAAFKRQHIGTLPDEMQTNADLLTTLNTQFEALSQALNRAHQDKAYAESVLAQQIQSWQMTKAARQGAGLTLTQGPDALDKQLDMLQGQLAELRARHTDDYPDVVAVKGQIADLKRRMPSVEPPAQQKSSTQPSDDTGRAKSLEPPEIQQLRAQVHAYEDTIQNDKREQQRLAGQIKEYQSRLQMIPGVEQEYKEITRDHDTALQFYKDLLGKIDQSQMATNMESREEGERFRVLDPASLPTKASFPKRPLFALGGFAAGIALGLAGALLLEMSQKRLRSEIDIEFYLGTTAFALIPIIQNEEKGGKRRAEKAA